MIYLDHAATSWPKPDAVVAACQHWLTDIGVSAERGDGPRTRAAADTVANARRGVAAITGHRPDDVAFCSGATEGLNLALRGLLREGRSVTTTPLEHSSVVRPLVALAAQAGVRIQLLEHEDGDAMNSEAFCNQLTRQPTDVVVFTHASNVTGGVYDARRICETARAKGITTVLDASQTAGYLSLDVGADVVIASCHKALHGPPGLGFVSKRTTLALPPQKQGGTGSSAALDQHPTDWPLAFEAGTPNTPAIFGLNAALEWLADQTSTALLCRALDALRPIEEGLRELPGIEVVEPGSELRTPVVSFTHRDYDPAEIGAILASANIHARTGFHCAPWAHQRLGTQAAGTVRISTGPHTTQDDTATLLATLRTL